MESYGIIYNKSLLKKYFDASWSSVKSIDGLNNFKALKTVADEIQEHKDDMGVKARSLRPAWIPRRSDTTSICLLSRCSTSTVMTASI